MVPGTSFRNLARTAFFECSELENDGKNGETMGTYRNI
jgi:hypothetical protein